MVCVGGRHKRYVATNEHRLVISYLCVPRVRHFRHEFNTKPINYLLHNNLEIFGAGDGNRTRVSSLGS